MEEFGKCNFINLETGLKCGCLRYRNDIQQNNLLCEGCGYDQTYHILISSQLSSHQDTTFYQPINSEINNIFKRNWRPYIHSISADSLSNLKFNPYHGVSNKNKNKKPPTTFSLICLPDGEVTPKIPRK